MTIQLTMKQLNAVNERIKQWQLSSLSRLSPGNIEKAQTNLLFFNMVITQEMQCQVIEDILQIESNIGDRITELN